jgi:UDP-glucose-4-epimerase GalE
MRVLVTGGAGYIGSQTVRLLQRRGHEPVVLDTLEHGFRAAVPGVQVVVASVEDRVAVRAALAEVRPDAVMHFAALKAAGESVERPARYFDVNVSGTFTLLGELVDAGVPHIVYSSSAAIYGEPDVNPIAEDARLHPTNPYGESKALIERALPWYDPVGLRHVSLRYFNAAGAEADGSHGEDPRGASNLIPRAVEAALTGRPLMVFGTDYPTPDGTAIRDYVHVLDIADAHVAALTWLADGGPSLAINLGTGRGWSVLDVIAAVERATGNPISILPVARRPGDAAAVWADTQHAAAVLGWRARLDLDDIVASAVAWQSRHPDGYSSVA